jgi:hypothetical protein
MIYGERRFGASYRERLLVAAGALGFLVALWVGQQGKSPSDHPGLMYVSIGVLATVAAAWILLGKTALIINDSGVRTETAFGQREMAWSQIAETRYRVVPVNVYGHFGLIGALVAMSSKSGRASLTLELISHDRKKLKVTSRVRNGDEAVGIILGRILPPMVQSAKARLQRGETIQFGGIGLNATAMTWKGSSIPVSELSKAELVRTNLQIKRTGKWLSAVNVRSDKIPDVLVFLEVLESLAPQMKSSAIDPLARVRM